MALRWRHAFVIGTLLTLSGCFQQSGEPLQPASNTAIPATTFNDNTEQIEDNSDLVVQPDTGNTNAPGTATFPPITVISQQTTSPLFPTSTPLVAPTETAGDSQIDITKEIITPFSPLMLDVDTEPTQVDNTGDVPPLTGNQTTPLASTQDSGIVNTQSNTNTNTNRDCTYTVQPGDNLYRIAINYGFSLDEMRQANANLVGEAPVLQVGQALNLPSCDEQTTRAQPDEPAGGVTPSPGGSAQSYTVQRGDTLLIIAQRFGTTIRAIQDANNLADPNRLSVGQILIIP